MREVWREKRGARRERSMIRPDRRNQRVEPKSARDYSTRCSARRTVELQEEARRSTAAVRTANTLSFNAYHRRQACRTACENTARDNTALSPLVPQTWFVARSMRAAPRNHSLKRKKELVLQKESRTPAGLNMYLGVCIIINNILFYFISGARVWGTRSKPLQNPCRPFRVFLPSCCLATIPTVL